MPITIDGTGSISGIVAGGLPDGSINNADLATDAVSTSKILNGAVTTAKMGSAEQSGLCKAWVNFDGTTASPSTIRGSYNVSSITKGSTGNYTVNFSTALTDGNYCTTVSISQGASQGGVAIVGQTGPNLNSGNFAVNAAGSVKIVTGSPSASSVFDVNSVNVAIFR